jgi:hypothetical protein
MVGDQVSEVVLVEAARHEDPNRWQSSLVEHAAGLDGKASQVATVESHTGVFCQA